VSGKDFVKFAKQNGWKVVRVQGSHHILKKGGIIVAVPVHGNKDLKPGTLADLRKKTGL
jgi:predicted RNA binding protein YcfA (HicA-like mRNA interferase family)